MNYLGPEQVGNTTAYRFARPDGGTALVGDPLQAQQMGAPVFANQAPQVAAPAAMPDMRTADMGAEFKAQADAATKDFAGTDLSAVATPGGPTKPTVRTATDAPTGPTVSLQPKGELPSQEQASSLTPGQEFTRGQAEAIAGNMLPVGVGYSPGRAGREATWQGAQRRGTSLTGDPNQDAEIVNAYAGSTAANYEQRAQSASDVAAEQMQAQSERKAEAIKNYTEETYKEVELSELAKRQDEAMKTRLASVEEAQREAENLKVDPNKLWKDKSGGEKLLMTLGMAFGAFGSAVSGGPNQAMDMINAYIKRDTDAQEDAIRQKKDRATGERSRYEDWLQTNSPELTRARMEAAKLGQAEAMARSMATDDAYRSIWGQLQQTLPQLAQEKNDKLMQVQQLTAKEVAETYLPEVTAVRGGMYRKPLTAKEAGEEMKVRGEIGAALDAGTATPDGMMRINDPSSGKPIGTVDKTIYQKQQDYANTARTTLDAIDKMESIGANWSSLNPEQRAAAEQQAKLFANTIFRGIMKRTDAPSGEEQSQVQEMAANPVQFFTSTKNAAARLKVLREATVNDGMNTFTGYGLDASKFNWGKRPTSQVE